MSSPLDGTAGPARGVAPEPAAVAPGSVEHVPLKVVPMYIEAVSDDGTGEPGEPPEIQTVGQRVRGPLVGIGALGLAVAGGVVHGVAVAVGTGGDGAGATILAIVAIVLTAAAFLAGLVAVVFGFGRRAGVVAMVLALVANPVVLLTVLRWVEGAAS